MSGIVIAIDGPAGAGKSTMARRLAGKLEYIYIDTGAMYRAVALWALRQGTGLSDSHRLEQLAKAAEIELRAGFSVHLNGEDVTEAIRTPEVSEAASKVAAVRPVRAALVAKQRAMAEVANVVMEGRDIGTVVFPNARVKIFLDAQSGERARRRAGEQPQTATGEVARQMAERDARDRGRVESPLVQAPDAMYLDSTGLSEDEVEERILKIIRGRVSNGKDHPVG